MKPQPKLNKPSKVLGLTAAIMTVATFAATISGTFSWFTYATRTYVEYEGVTIGDLGQLECGIRSIYDIPEARTLFGNDNVETCEDGSFIYWAKEKLTNEMITSVTKVSGYALKEINPVTTGAYDGGEFHLYDSPLKGNKSISPENYAEKKSYSYIPFVFRVESLKEGEEGTYIPDMPIYLSRADLSCETNIHKSIRMFTDNGANHYLISPAEASDGSTKVGGTLNILKDDYYDTYLGEDGEIYETAYGQFEGVVEYKDEKNTGDIEVPHEQVTSFLANHRNGSHSIKDTCKPKEAKYKGMSNFRKGRTPITATTGNKNYAELSLTIFSEGWDYSVIDSEEGNPYSLDLKFEIVF